MRTSSVMKWSVAAAALLGLGVMMVGSADAAQDSEGEGEGEGLKGIGVRHGIQYEGCGHFDLVDPDAVEAWGRSNALRFAKWVTKLDELREEPEPAITEAMAMLFPECSWPPAEGTTLGPERESWSETMARAKEAIGSFDLTGGMATTGPGVDPQGTIGKTVARVLALSLRGPMMDRRRRG